MSAYGPAKWDGDTLGVGATVSWAIAQTQYLPSSSLGHSISSGVGLSWFMPSGYEESLQLAFDAWDNVANIDFQKVDENSSPDILLGGGAIGESVLGYAVYTYQYYPNTQLSLAEIVFDTEETWVLQGTSRWENNTFYSNLYEVAVHEIGHAIGLDHEDTLPSIMHSIVAQTATDLTSDDTQAIQYLYGEEIVLISDNTVQGRYQFGTASKSDLLTYSGSHADYTISINTTENSISTSNGISDTLVDVERLQFSDGTLALDTSGNAGQTYRMYQAAFGRTPDTSGLSHNVNLVDGGLSIWDMADAFAGSAEFQTLFGESSSNETFINAMYQNVLGRFADTAGYNGWNAYLTSGEKDRGDILIGFSESTENIALVGSAIESGIWLG